MRLKSKFIATVALVTLLALTTRGQQILTLKGIVVDKGSNPVAGCNVMIKGTFTGTVTNHCGEFSIPLGQDDFTIVFHDSAYKDGRASELGLKIKEITSDKIVFQIGGGVKKNKDCEVPVDKGLKRYRI